MFASINAAVPTPIARFSLVAAFKANPPNLANLFVLAERDSIFCPYEVKFLVSLKPSAKGAFAPDTVAPIGDVHLPLSVIGLLIPPPACAPIPINGRTPPKV